MEIPSCIVTRQRKWFSVELSISALGNQGQFPILKPFFFFFGGKLKGVFQVLTGEGPQITPTPFPEAEEAKGPASQTKQP